MAAKRPSSKGGGTATAEKPKETSGLAAVAAGKRAAAQERDNELRPQVVKLLGEGKKLSDVAKQFKITSGKAAFLLMQHKVAQGEVPSIKGKDDEALLKAIDVERRKANEYSSWGWLAARSSRTEGFIKTGLEKLGLYTPKAENIASKRAEAAKANGSADDKKSSGKGTGAKRSGAKRPTSPS